MNNPLVSIIIPCRNEEKFIARCLNSVLGQDYPKDKIEILTVDGRSDDGTKQMIKKYIQQYPSIKLLDNPKRVTPAAFNIGIKNSYGELIIIMGAHSIYEKNYISKCVKYSNEYGADNVGGVWKIMPAKNTLINKAIVFASGSAFGAGNAYYRKGYSKGVKWVDTVFGGCYKKEVFEKIGLFNENLKRNQDLEFNLRLRKAGGKILLCPDIITYYYPKSTFIEFWNHNFEDGFWVTYPLKFGVKAFSLRHLMPLIFVSSLIGTGILGIFFLPSFWLFLGIFGLYIVLSFYFCSKIVIKEKNWRYFFLMPIAFSCRHIAYGLGSVKGILDFIIKF